MATTDSILAATANPKFLRRFWAKVKKYEDCWEWQGSSYAQGYGEMRVGGRKAGRTSAHRISWVIANQQPIPSGKIVMHRCDNPRCVRPDHLELGTQKQNINDAYDRGRLVCRHAETNPNHKLTQEQVREMRRLWETGELQRNLASRFGISASLVSRIVRGKYRSATSVVRQSPLTARKVGNMRAMAASGTIQADLARRYKVSQPLVCRILAGQIWKITEVSSSDLGPLQGPAAEPST